MSTVIETLKSKLHAADISISDQEKLLGILQIADEQDLALIAELMEDAETTKLLVQNLKQKIAALQSNNPDIAAAIIGAEVKFLQDLQEQEVRQNITDL